MLRQRLITPGILLALTLATALSGEGPAVSAQSPTASAGTATPAAGRQVDIHFLAYAPDPIEIYAGESIHWTNQDALPHTVTSAAGDAMASEPLALGESYTQTFSEPGTYDYTCLFHKQMHGQVVVRGD